MRINNKHPPRLPPRVSGDSQPKPTVTPECAKQAVHSTPQDRFENTVSSRNTVSPPASKQSDVQSLLRKQFGTLAADKQRFHETLRGVFGEGYDASKAEQYRQKALAGDFDWMPPVQWVESDVLGGAHGAYDSESGTVLLNRALQGDPALAASTYVEEAGHHLDAQLNTVDSLGDEGELFRRILGGEKLTRAQVAEIRAENDKGTIQLNGRSVQVEFWKPFKAIGKAISGAAKAVGNAIVNTAKGVANAAVSVGQGVVGGVKTFFTGIGQGVGGFFSNLVRLRVGDAFQSLVRGADKAFLQAPQRILNGLIEGAGHLGNGLSHLMGPLGKPVRALGTRILDAARTVIDTGTGIVRDVFRTVTETPVLLVRGVEESIRLATQGKWGKAAARLGKGVADTLMRPLGGAVDVVLRGIQGAVNASLTVSFAEAPSRSLSGSEIQTLRQLYGDSIDYSMVRIKRGGSTDWTGMAAHVVGNTIYLPTRDERDDNFNPDGSLTEAGMETLMHEAGHVWQNQNGGGDFVHRALLAQLISVFNSESGTRNDAYEWRDGFARGLSFAELNPEQQATLMEEIGRGLKNDGVVTAADWGLLPLSVAELSYVMNAWQMVKRGEGSR